MANNLTTTASGYALDARQGKALNDKYTSLNSNMKDIKYSAPWYYKKIGEYNGYNVVEMWSTKSYTNMSATTADGSLYRSSSQVFSEITPFTIEEVLRMEDWVAIIARNA